MTSPQFDPAHSMFCVVVHDVTPFFAREIERVLSLLQPLVGKAVAGAVVPRWAGRAPNAPDRRRLADWSNRLGELLLHGWTHRREDGRGVVSRCTGGADEFEGLSPQRVLQRVRRAQLDAEDLLGRPMRGFVPPAWRLRAGVTHLRPAGIEYLMRFRSLEAYGNNPVPLATWSWDWGWLPGTRLAGATLGAYCRWRNPRSVPAVVLHPLDVRRGWLPAAQRLIGGLLSSGLRAVLPRQLAAAVWNRQS